MLIMISRARDEDYGSLGIRMFIFMPRLMCLLDWMHQGDKSLVSQGKLHMDIYKDMEVANKGKVRVVRLTL